jgi:V/A-type H+-transporting ATPase subunit A
MSRAIIQWISGPVIRARPLGSFVMRESVRIGEKALLGEVIRLREEEIIIQVYEDTTGIRPGDQIVGDEQPLSIKLGPSILGGTFDGLLRPILDVDVDGPWVKAGALSTVASKFYFTPKVSEGDWLDGGTILGKVTSASGFEQQILIPPAISGNVKQLVSEGKYQESSQLCQLIDKQAKAHPITMTQMWPARKPRPIASRLPSYEPMLTGQRIIDCLFPVARGSKAAIPGGFGTGKTVLLETLAKWCNADVIVYVGCGERGNELAGLLEEFAHLEDPKTGRLLIERTVLIANTSNMPVAAREASIYSGVTVAEYYRDQGFDVALMADSTSRWAEALREVSGRLGELPGEGGYPAYLSSRLADFYERAAKAKTLSGETGSVTLMGAVSPPSGDFSEPVTSHTRRFIRSFWALDTHRAHARFYPAIHPLYSYSTDADNLARWWHAEGCTRWEKIRIRFLELLDKQAHLERMAKIIGKDAMPPGQRFILLCADLLNEGFLRQSAFSKIDSNASPQRQAVMMRILGDFFEQAEQLVSKGIPPESISDLPVYRRLMRMSEEIPDEQWETFSELADSINKSLLALLDNSKHSQEM